MGALLSTRPQPTPYVAKPLPILPPVVVPSDLDLSLRGPRCTVCLEYDMEFPRATPTPGCTHKIDVCLSCLRSYVTSGVEGALSLRCPTIGCIGQLDVAEIQTWIGESHRQEFERFCEMKVRYFLQKEQGLVWCRAPGCGSGQIHDGGAAYPIVTCQTCSARTCFIHDSIWHEGQTCDEYSRELAARAKAAPIQARAAKKSESWIKSHTKLCPGEGCNRPIQKNRGCDHMTCHKPAGCGHEFCWRCLAPYADIREGGNGKHKPSCKYYSSK